MSSDEDDDLFAPGDTTVSDADDNKSDEDNGGNSEAESTAKSEEEVESEPNKIEDEQTGEEQSEVSEAIGEPKTKIVPTSNERGNNNISFNKSKQEEYRRAMNSVHALQLKKQRGICHYFCICHPYCCCCDHGDNLHNNHGMHNLKL